MSIVSNEFDDLIQIMRNSKNLSKKVHRISLHTVTCPSIFEGENFGEIFGGLFFLKGFFEFLVNWIRSSNLFETMLIIFKKPAF
jgi:uncharacterized membrane protein